jgi:HEAT repeat protein
LLELLSDEDADGRWASSTFLADLAASVPEALPHMVTALADPNENVRFHAARYLSSTAPASRSGIPGLINCLQDEDEDVQQQAASALGNLALAGCREEMKAAIPVLIGLVTNPEIQNRRLYMNVLADIDPYDGRVVEVLTNLCSDEDEFVQSEATSLLAGLGKRPS